MIESPAVRLVDALVARHGKDEARRILTERLDATSVVELAALAYDWRNFWARPKQVIPIEGWRSFGFLMGRGTGKTTACAAFIVDEIREGRARCIGLAAQKEEKTLDVQVGGLEKASPPWFRPTWHTKEMVLEWPNGAIAYAHTPEVPGAIRSHNFDLSWLSEVQSWPNATRSEAYLNFANATRVGLARTLWDATPKRRHPMLRAWLARAVGEPDRHIVIRGAMHENRRNLAAGVIEDLEKEFGGTTAGREELLGEMIEDSDAAIVKEAWINVARRHLPTKFERQVIAIDPAVSTRRGTDRTGVIRSGLGVDRQVYICRDYSGKHRPEEWSKIVVDEWLAEPEIDCVVVERNKGGELVASVLRLYAASRGINVVVLGPEEKPSRRPGTLYVKEVYARGKKADRAQPLATAYERGRVSHVIGENLAQFEETLTTWEPREGADSPDDLDAAVHAVCELLGLGNTETDGRAMVAGLSNVTRQLVAARPVASAGNLAALLGGGRAGRGI